MNSFYFEEKLKEYFNLASKEKSVRLLTFKLVNIIKELLDETSEAIKEVYIVETSPTLFQLLEKYSVFGVEPIYSAELVKVVNEIKPYLQQSENIQHIEDSLNRIEEELNILNEVLTGGKIDQKSSMSFPVNEKSGNLKSNYGMIEQIQISIYTNKKSNKVEFLIMPSLPKLEERFEEQILKSWNYAVNYLKSRYKKFNANLEVTIKFVNKLGIYEGNSLGVALTIGFIQELLRYYNLRDAISYENNIISTGSMEEKGEIGEVGEEIISLKVETVFYSMGDIFLIPQKDYAHAEKKINTLLEKYPKRNLTLIPIREINDVIMRRDALKIERQNIIKWSGKKLLKNKIVVTLLFLLVVILSGVYYVNYDDNPSQIEVTKNRYKIKNKSGKILWYKERMQIEYISNNTDYSWNSMRIIDIDNNGKNEVFLTLLKESYKLFLFDNKGNEIWSFSHTDSVASSSENFTGNFEIRGIIDTISQNGRKVIFAYFQHNAYYPSGILTLDLATGKKVNNILWNSGAITGAILEDWNEDGKKEIIAGGASNGMNSAFLFSIDYDNLEGSSPSSEDYILQNIRIADYNKYYIFEQTDYGNYLFPKYSAVLGRPIINNILLQINIYEGNADFYNSDFGYVIRFDKGLEPIKTVIGDQAIVERDRLVKEGKLNYPLTDTFEFHHSIMNNIKYWDGDKFVKFNKEANRDL